MRAHTATLVNWLPISAVSVGLLRALAATHAPAANLLVPLALWASAGGFALFWLMRDRAETGFAKSRWLSFFVILPFFQVVPLSYYLFRTRGLRQGLICTAGLILLVLVFFGAYIAGARLGEHLLA